ncbi:uncharacterized protein B0T15DRAFT_570167 [Chaetomium strumarium]|uniref:Uncharacterized protein n=1 Tax=Chaetomium strumarium TaxID=1170767 RepID=A0AAJ0H049_9PEZI|nr:hypothetical protein B0T15DRAFT_570167 [Chaetomium strumarium]
MGTFSRASASASCSALSKTAQSAAAKIETVLSSGDVGDDALRKQLSVMSARLELFRHHAEQLGRCIADAPVVHPELGNNLTWTLADSSNALGSIADTLAPGSGGLDRGALSLFENLVAACSRFFVLGSQLLIMETEQEQHSKLVDPGASSIVAAANVACHTALAFNYATEN